MRAAVCIALLAFIATSSADEKKPDFKVTAEELTTEFKKDKETYKKYVGKLVEVTGPFHVRRPGTDDVLLSGQGSDFVSCTPDAASRAKHQRLYGLARGQKITFRGVMADNRFSPVLGKCELVSVGPSPAVLVTQAKLKAMFAKPADAKKNEDRPVVLRVRVVSLDKSERSRVTYAVTDATSKAKSPPTTEVVVDTHFDSDRIKELHAVKPGEVCYVLGVARSALGTVRLWDAVLLKEPPEGMKKDGKK